MRHTLLAFLAPVLLAAPALAQSKTYPITGFRKIAVDSAFTVEFTQSPTWSVAVDSRYNNLDKVTVEKVGDTLRISRPNNTNIRHEVEDIVRISAPSLDEITLHSAVEFTAGRLAGDRLDLNTHSATKVSISDLNVKALDIDGHSAAAFSLRGECQTLHLEVDSASKVEAKDLHCREATIDAGTASSVSAWASEKVFARADVASKVVISGKPRSFEKKASEFANVSLAD